MLLDPLGMPQRDSPLLARFSAACHIDRAGPARDVIARLAAAFARLPYENLTKIIKHARSGNVAQARRGPEEVLDAHFNFGTGGTCFSLTATLLHLVRSLGIEAQPILADRRYGPDTHCALLVWLDGKPHLLDPGYLLVEPILLPTYGSTMVATPMHDVVLTARDEGARVDLTTVRRGQRTYRLTYKTRAVDAPEFLRAWDASFAWDMMHYPVLTRIADGKQLYLQKNQLMIRGGDAVQRGEIGPDDLVRRIATEFGVAADVAARACAILRRRGELER